MSDGIVYGLNDAAAAWWSWMAPMAWQVALLVAVVWAIDRIARRWVWPQVLHALWLLVPLKLVLPPSLASPVSLVGRLIPARAVESVATIAPAPAPMPDFPAMMPPIDASAMPVPPPEFTWHVALAALWVAGMIALIGLLIVRLRAFSRILRSTATVPASAEIVEAAHRAAARLGLRRVPRIVRTPAVESPAAFGPFRPVILLPADEQYAPEEIDGILLHELAHAKRADLLAHAMLTAFMFAYWFNPALWLAGRRIRALRELSCDATVAAVLRDETPTYRKTLLAAARRMLRRHEALSIGLLGITEDGSMMESRLRWLTGRPWKNRRTKIAVAMFVAICTTASLLPMARPTVSRAADAVVKAVAPVIAAAPRTTARMDTTVAAVASDTTRAPISYLDRTYREMYTLPEEGRPKVIADVTPVYPANVRGMRREEQVKLLVSVNARGTVDTAVVMSGPREFDESALAAARRLRFTPGTIDGRAVPVRTLHTIVFRRDPANPEPPSTNGYYDVWQIPEAGRPRIVGDPTPEYPPNARSANLTGDVFVQAYVGAQGATDSARVLQGPPIFAQAATDAARLMRFSPAMLDGRAVLATVAVRISYRSDGTKAEISDRPPNEFTRSASEQTAVAALSDGRVMVGSGRGGFANTRADTMEIDRLAGWLRERGIRTVNGFGAAPPRPGETQWTEDRLYETMERGIVAIRRAGISSIAIPERPPHPSQVGNLENLAWIRNDNSIMLRTRTSPQFRQLWFEQFVAEMKKPGERMTIQIWATNEFARPMVPSESEPRFGHLFAAIRETGHTPYVNSNVAMSQQMLDEINGEWARHRGNTR